MGGGVWVSTYAVRRLKYEKVDRVEQIGKLSKISEPILPTCFFPRKLDGREKLSGGRKLFLRHYLRYYRIIEKIISKYSCILSVENPKEFSQNDSSTKLYIIIKDIQIPSTRIRNEYDTRNVKETSRQRNKIQFLYSQGKQCILSIKYHTFLCKLVNKPDSSLIQWILFSSLRQGSNNQNHNVASSTNKTDLHGWCRMIKRIKKKNILANIFKFILTSIWKSSYLVIY